MWIKNIWILLVTLTFVTSCIRVPTEIKINGSLNEGDSISVALCLASNEQYIPSGYCVISREMANNNEAVISITDINEKIISFSISVLSKQNKQQIGITSISLSKISSLNANELVPGIWWEKNASLYLNPTSDTLLLYLSENSSATFSNDILPFYLKYHKKNTTPLSIVFILLAISLLIRFLKKNNLRSIVVISIICYIICFPLIISWSNLVLALLGVIVLIAFIKNKDRQFTLSNTTFCGLIFIFLIYLIGIVYPDTNYRWSKIPLLSTILLFIFIFSIIILNKKEILLILQFYILCTMLYCMYILTGYISAIPIFGLDSLIGNIINAKRFSPFLFTYPSFSHPSLISIIILISIPFSVYLRMKKKMTWIKLAISIILISIIVLLSGTRIGLAVVPLALALGFLFYLKIPQYIKYIIVSIGCIFAFILFSNPSIKEKFNDPIRQDLRTTAIASIKEKPFFGWGTNSMETLLHSEDIAQKAGLEEPIAAYNHFHNQYLDMLVQFGFIGSIPFFALFIYLIYLAIKKKDFLLMAYLAIYLPFMWVESPFATAKGIQPMIFWLCFLVSTQKVRLDNEAVAPHPENKITSM